MIKILILRRALYTLKMNLNLKKLDIIIETANIVKQIMLSENTPFSLQNFNEVELLLIMLSNLITFSYILLINFRKN